MYLSLSITRKEFCSCWWLLFSQFDMFAFHYIPFPSSHLHLPSGAGWGLLCPCRKGAASWSQEECCASTSFHYPGLVSLSLYMEYDTGEHEPLSPAAKDKRNVLSTHLHTLGVKSCRLTISSSFLCSQRLTWLALVAGVVVITRFKYCRGIDEVYLKMCSLIKGAVKG